MLHVIQSRVHLPHVFQLLLTPTTRASHVPPARCYSHMFEPHNLVILNHHCCIYGSWLFPLVVVLGITIPFLLVLCLRMLVKLSCLNDTGL